jgi:tRNA G10  N-methylase Trm11
LVEEVFVSAQTLLSVGQRICIALPIRVNEKGETERLAEVLAGFIGDLGFELVESHLVYVHRTLTREVCVFCRLAAGRNC